MHTLLIAAPKRWSQEDCHKSEASLRYVMNFQVSMSCITKPPHKPIDLFSKLPDISVIYFVE